MSEYDWMTDPSFREEVKSAVAKAAGRAGMEKYHTAIVDRLMSHLESNRELLLEQEMVKTAGMREKQGGCSFVSRISCQEGIGIAAGANRRVVQTEDFDQAHRDKFCMVWPFCGKGK
jgi:hypothetical protein